MFASASALYEDSFVLTIACSILLSIATALVPDALIGIEEKIQNQLRFVRTDGIEFVETQKWNGMPC